MLLLINPTLNTDPSEIGLFLVTQCRLDIGILVIISRVISSSFEVSYIFLIILLPHIFTSICRVQNAEVLCFGLVSVAVFVLVMPLFRATGGILLQMAPPSIPPSALNKCWRQVIYLYFNLFLY